jgi:hypothetical protein
VSPVDAKIEGAADKLQEKAEQWSVEDGVKAKLADELAADAAFLRKLKPSLMKARARGEAPKGQKPDQDVKAPGGPQLGARPKPKAKAPGGKGGGPSPWLVLGGALVAGVVIAKWLDWRGHAHPRD